MGAGMSTIKLDRITANGTGRQQALPIYQN